MSEQSIIPNNDLQLLAIPQLMKKHFFIPDYQRGYRWEEKQVYQLLEDLWKYFKEGVKQSLGFYCLQPIVAKQCTQETVEKYDLPDLSGIPTYDTEDESLQKGPRNDVWYEIIDGQQRLTTIRILLAFYNAVNIFSPSELFELSYATRPEFKDIFRNIVINPVQRSITLNPEFTFHNIDVEYVRNCAELVIKWFTDDTQVESNKFNQIGNFLSNFYNDATKDVNVEVIWYETKEGTDARDIFERLNNLKVPLSSSELIRAIFLSDNAYFNCTLTPYQQALTASEKELIREEERRRKQSSINAKWDEIEHFFHNDRLWAFVTNKDACEYRNRIELLFDFMSKKYAQPKNSTAASDRLFTYLYFENQKKDLWELWLDVVKYYDTIRFWFENKDYYHKIGYLIHEKHDSILISLLEYANSDQHKKSEFDKKLDDEIRATVNQKKKFSELSYDDKSGDYEVLKTLLLLYNVEYTRIHATSAGDWFPFSLYKEVEKKNTWTLEHIHAQNSECLDKNKRTEWRDWIAYTIVVREKILNPDEEMKALVYDLKKEKEILDKEIKNNVAKEGNYEKIVDLFKRDLNLWSGGKAYTVMHQLSNLALLSGDINSGIGKGSFSLKQQYINKCLADGRYIPICTGKVFLKHYYPASKDSEQSELLQQQFMTWDDQDRACYLEDIKSVLGTYFGPEKF